MMFVTAELMGAALMEAQFDTKPALTACKDTSECFQYIVEKAEPSGAKSWLLEEEASSTDY